MRQGSAHQEQTPAAAVTGIGSRGMCCVALFACLFVIGCDQPKQPAIEEPPTPQPAVASVPVQLPKISSPRLLEVQEAVKRVFKDAARLDKSRNPNFLAGDFNGDLSQDIAVILKVAPGKLAEMNEEFPSWILRDVSAPNKLRTTGLRVEENDQLLAVIHGYGANDWRDHQATQTYLLKNAVGFGMEVHAGKDFVAANSGKKLPRLHGDLIGQTLQGASGYLYFAGSAYGWYDPKTFKGEPERRFVHSRVAKVSKVAK